MTATNLASATQYDRARAAQHAQAIDRLERIGDLSQVVERDIERLKTNLAEYRNDRPRNESWEHSWARLESAWESVRSELANGKAPTSGTEVPFSTSPSSTVTPQVDELTESFSPMRSFDRVIRDVVGSACQFALASATRLRRGWQAARARFESAWKTVTPELTNSARQLASACATQVRSAWVRLVANSRRAKRVLMSSKTKSKPVGERVRIVERSNPVERNTTADREATRIEVQARVESARKALRSQPAQGASAPPAEVASTASLASTAGLQVEEPTTASPAAPFVQRPLPWVSGALGPVISSRTMQIHHGCHHSKCIETANRLSRNHKELAGKSALEIVRWARGRGRDPELLAAASDAWNHSLFWQSLTPLKKRPGGDLRRALDRKFGGFANFAHEFASVGATHVGSGWLWLVANRRKQVKILTTSNTDCPEARGYTCLLAIDLWEHAYYFDHQNRRREYLDAVIDRRLDWEFAESRYRLALESDTSAGCELRDRPSIRTAAGLASGCASPPHLADRRAPDR